MSIKEEVVGVKDNVHELARFLKEMAKIDIFLYVLMLILIILGSECCKWV